MPVAGAATILLFRIVAWKSTLVLLVPHVQHSSSFPFRWPPPVMYVVLRVSDFVAHPLFGHCRQGFHRITTRLGGTANLNTSSSSQQSFLWTHEGLSRGNPVVQVGGEGVLGLTWCASPGFAVMTCCIGTGQAYDVTPPPLCRGSSAYGSLDYPSPRMRELDSRPVGGVSQLEDLESSRFGSVYREWRRPERLNRLRCIAEALPRRSY